MGGLAEYRGKNKAKPRKQRGKPEADPTCETEAPFDM